MALINQLITSSRTTDPTAPIANEDILAVTDAATSMSQTDLSKAQSPLPPAPSTEFKTAEDIRKEHEWNSFWGGVGETLAVPNQIATSLLVNVGTISQEIANVASQEKSGEGELFDKLGQAWNWESFYEEERLDIGTAFLFAVSQVGRVGHFLPASLMTLSGARKSMLPLIEDTNNMIRDFGLGFTTGTFDIFSAEDRSYMAYGNDKPVNLGTVITGIFNFAGDVATDPISYIPFGPVAKATKGILNSRRALGNNAEAIVKTQNDLIVAAYGKNNPERLAQITSTVDNYKQSTGLREFLRFVATTKEEGVIGQHRVFREIKDSHKDNLVSLAAKMDSEEDVAKLLLAAQYGETRAATELVKKYGKDFDDPGIIFQIDELITDGGKMGKVFIDGLFAGPTLNKAVGPEYMASLKNLTEKIERDEFSKVLFAAMKDVGTDGSIVIRRSPSMQRDISGNLLINKFEQLSANLRARVFVDNNTLRFVYKQAGRPVIHFIAKIPDSSRRAFMTADRRVFDATNSEGDQIQKVLSYLDDADRFSQGKFTSNGYREKTLTSWRKATTDEERRNVLLEMQIDAQESLMRSSGVDITDAEKFRESIKTIYLDKSKAKRENGMFISSTTGLIEKEVLLPGQTANLIELEDLANMNKLIAKSKQEGTFGKIKFGLESLAEVGTKGYADFNSIWSQLTLLAPRRVPRELMQGSLSAFLSGYWLTGMGGVEGLGAALLSGSRNVYINLKGNLDEAVSGTKIITGRSTSIKELSRLKNELDSNINKIDNTLDEFNKEYIERFGNAKLSEISDNELEIILGAKIALDESRAIHFTQDVSTFGKNIDDTLPIVSFSERGAADSFAQTRVKTFNMEKIAGDTKEISKIQKAIDEGKTVYITSSNFGTRKATGADINAILTNKTVARNFKIEIYDGPNAGRVSVRSVGRKTEFNKNTFTDQPELMKILGLKTQKEWDQYIESGAWKKDKSLVKWANENVVGSIKVVDKVSKSGFSVIAIPRWSTASSANKSIVNLRQEAIEQLSKIARKDSDGILDDVIKLKGSRKVEARAAAIKREVDYLPSDVSVEQIAKMRAFRDELARYRDSYDKALLASIAAREARRTAPKARMGEGKIRIGEQEANDALATNQGKFGAAKAANGNAGMARTATQIAQPNSKTTGRAVKPNDEEYFPTVAKFINRMLKNPDGTPNTITRLVLENKSEKQILIWLKNTPEGISYQKQLGIGQYAHPTLRPTAMTPEDWVTEVTYSIRNYIPDERLAKEILDGKEITAGMLIDRYGKLRNELPELIGLFDEPKMVRTFGERGRLVVSEINKFLSDLPNQTIIQTPIFRGAYRVSVKERFEAFQKINGRLPNAAEINSIEQQSLNFALREVRKFTYNVVNSSRLEEGMRMLSPFIAAQVWQAKSLIYAASQNPARLGYLAYMFNKAVSNVPWIDANGNPTNNPSEAKGIAYRVSPEFRSVVKNMPFFAGFAETEELQFSLRSLDPIFGGEMMPFIGDYGLTLPNPFMPGTGPVVGIVVSELMKNNPDNPLLKTLNEYVINVLPYGPSDEPLSLDKLIPGRTAQLLIDKGFQTGEWMTTFNQILIYEQAQYELGKRETVPTSKEIIKMTNAAYDMKTASAFFLPIATQYRTEFDVARRLWRQYQTAYGQEAFSKFMVEHGDLIYATISTSKNPYGIDYTRDSVENLKKNSELVDQIAFMGEDAQDMLPFIINADERQEFSQDAYAWLKSNGPASPTAGTYLSTMDEAEIRQKISAAYGWAAWNKGMDKIDSIAIERGIDPDDERYYASLKSELRNSILQSQFGDAWNREYGNITSQKYEDRIIALELAFSNPKWIRDNKDKQGVKAISLFVSARNAIKDELITRRNQGKPGTLAGNPDLKRQYNDTIQQLKKESLVFADFFNRYFEGDRVG